ncbi:MAG: CBS domain-containing protein [Candidatus Methanosuratincola sp.]|jgi:CBS domain-containing protein|nr:CBS domain-containing protein [Candidatus Methanosuratincola sp.]
MSSFPAASIARHPPAVVLPEKTSVHNALKQMDAKSVRHAIVSEDGVRLTGIVSAKDLLNLLGGGDKFASVQAVKGKSIQSLLAAPISPIVNRRPILGSVSSPLPELMGIMSRHDIGMLPLINEDGTVWGVLSERHLFRLFEAQQMFVRVSEIMSAPLISLDVRASLLDAMKLMIKNDIRRIPITKGLDIWGIVTVKDIIRFLASPYVDALLEKDLFDYLLNVNVSKIATANPKTVDPDLDLSDAVKIMNASNIGSLIVVSNGKPIGMLTERDFLLKLPKLRGVEFMTDVNRNRVLVGRIHF